MKTINSTFKQMVAEVPTDVNILRTKPRLRNHNDNGCKRIY